MKSGIHYSHQNRSMNSRFGCNLKSVTDSTLHVAQREGH